MCGFVGFANFKKNVSKDKNILENMNNKLSRRGPDEHGYYIDNNVGLAHKRLIVIDPKGRKAAYDRNILFWKLYFSL